MPALVKIDPLFVKIAPQMKNSCSSGTINYHKLPKTTKQLSFRENGHGIQKNDQTIWG